MQLAAPELVTLLTIGLVQAVAVISPGPSFLITARTAVAQSRGDGVKVALGVGIGSAIWAAAALLGLNVIFQAFPLLFTAMKIFGALFLMWLAYRIFVHARDPLVIDGGQGEITASPFLKGMLTQVSNPKAAVFFGSIFIAMLPSTVPLWMTVTLVVMVAINEIWWFSAVALFFGSGPVRQVYIRAKAWIDRVTGVFLGLLGIRLLWAVRSTV